MDCPSAIPACQSSPAGNRMLAGVTAGPSLLSVFCPLAFLKMRHLRPLVPDPMTSFDLYTHARGCRAPSLPTFIRPYTPYQKKTMRDTSSSRRFVGPLTLKADATGLLFYPTDPTFLPNFGILPPWTGYHFSHRLWKSLSPSGSSSWLRFRDCARLPPYHLIICVIIQSFSLFLYIYLLSKNPHSL